jgi:small GTP-binding protein
LSNLIRLTRLSLNFNQIRDCSFLLNLIHLTALSLSSNQIKDCSFLSNLTYLKVLDLSSNQISDCSFLSTLTELTKVNLSSNQLTDLSSMKSFFKEKMKQVVWKEWFVPEVEEIIFKNNPLINPPIEIVEQGGEAILRYFEKFDNKKDKEIRYVDEAKVLLIGQPRAGKTTLRKKLCSVESEMPKDEETTRGIDIESLYFDFRDKEGHERRFKFNIWDFGGQEIYHATHRFFLTSRSLYIAVVNTDMNDKQNDLDYWLHIVELLGGDSPVLLLQNQKNERTIAISKNVKERFVRLLKKKFILDLNRLNKNVNTFDQKRLDEFREFESELHLMLTHLPQTSIKILPEELAVRDALQEISKKQAVISKKDFKELCQEKGLINPAMQSDFLRLLHELGVLLYFEKNEFLERVVILQNKWATDAVFKILDAPQVAKNQGYFNKEDSDEIWNSPEYEGKEMELRALMREFKLCYQIGQTDKFIAPQLLPKNHPNHYQWQTKVSDLRMVVEYEFMPRGIMTQFIVGMHRDIAEGQHLVWQTGFVAEQKDLINTRAEVSESYDNRRIEIKVQGLFSGLLLQRLVDELRKINFTYQNLEPDELLPCICQKCLNLPIENRYHFKYKSLLNSLYVNRVDEKQCDKSDLQVPIEMILGPAGFDRSKQEKDARNILDGQRSKTQEEVVIDLNKEIKTTLKSLLSKEKTTEVIEQLLDYSEGKDNDLNNAVLVLSARLTRITEKEIKKVIDYTAADIERNQINDALTILIDRL